MQAQVRDPRRNVELAKIHIAKKQLGLDDETYRDAVRRASLGRSESAGELKPAERGVLLEIFKKAGFKGAKRGPEGSRPAKTGARRPAVDRPQAAKIRALWYALWLLAEVESRSDKAIDAFCKRQTRVEALAWLKPAQANQVIEALKAWCERVGFYVVATHGGEDLALDAKIKLVETIWRLLGPDSGPNLGQWMAANAAVTRAPHGIYSAAELDAAAEKLGRSLRTKKGLPS